MIDNQAESRVSSSTTYQKMGSTQNFSKTSLPRQSADLVQFGGGLKHKGSFNQTTKVLFNAVSHNMLEVQSAAESVLIGGHRGSTPTRMIRSSVIKKKHLPFGFKVQQERMELHKTHVQSGVSFEMTAPVRQRPDSAKTLGTRNRLV